jgi:hypothetical protein
MTKSGFSLNLFSVPVITELVSLDADLPIANNTGGQL